jgi:hypothetical protein
MKSAKDKNIFASPASFSSRDTLLLFSNRHAADQLAALPLRRFSAKIICFATGVPVE